MRNWDEETHAVPNPSSKSSSQNLAEAVTPTMAPNQPKHTLSDLGISQVKYNEKIKDESTSTLTEPTTLPSTPPFTDAATKKLLWKLDLHLIPFLALLYL
jgi:hypothetical protein